jgi:hypothetical protein
MSRRPILHTFTKALLLGLLSLCGSAFTTAQGVTPIIMQPAEWSNMATSSPTGTRTNAPVTFGLGIPDAWAVPCTLQATPAQLELKNGTTLLNSEFRTLACWQPANANTSSATISVNGLGTVDLAKAFPGGATSSGGQLVSTISPGAVIPSFSDLPWAAVFP